MKNFFPHLILFFLFSITHAQEKKELYTINEQIVHLEFTTEYQLEDISDVKKDLAKHDITIIYSSLQFDEKGFLKQISASINYPDGQKGSFVSSELKKETGPGFRRDFKK
jgi:hypothetical protein